MKVLLNRFIFSSIHIKKQKPGLGWYQSSPDFLETKHDFRQSCLDFKNYTRIEYLLIPFNTICKRFGSEQVTHTDGEILQAHCSSRNDKLFPINLCRPDLSSQSDNDLIVIRIESNP